MAWVTFLSTHQPPPHMGTRGLGHILKHTPASHMNTCDLGHVPEHTSACLQPGTISVSVALS